LEEKKKAWHWGGGPHISKVDSAGFGGQNKKEIGKAGPTGGKRKGKKKTQAKLSGSKKHKQDTTAVNLKSRDGDQPVEGTCTDLRPVRQTRHPLRTKDSKPNRAGEKRRDQHYPCKIKKERRGGLGKPARKKHPAKT